METNFDLNLSVEKFIEVHFTEKEDTGLDVEEKAAVAFLVDMVSAGLTPTTLTLTSAL